MGAGRQVPQRSEGQARRVAGSPQEDMSTPSRRNEEDSIYPEGSMDGKVVSYDREEAEMKCSICGRDVEPSWSNCRSCGARVPDAKLAVMSPPGPAAAPLSINNGPLDPVVSIPETSGEMDEKVRAASIESAEAPPSAADALLDASPPVPAEPAGGRRRSRPGLTIVAWGLAALALVIAVGLGFSLNGRLSSTRAELVSARSRLESTRSKLRESEARADTLGGLISDLSSRNDQLDSDLVAASHKNASVSSKLDACRDAFQMIVNHPHPTSAQVSKFESLIRRCYGGRPPFPTG